ncbi:MAG: PCMD domain-containing protein, partial [Bacteroidales bacterium]|nr:PCMD domain-containing protein [Bacteroidales bacterium]
NVSRISAGKLFLGSYSYNGSSETYNEGTAFASRPASLCGYYRYVCDPQDTSEKGTVEVKVMNGSTVIGSGRATLAAADGFTRFEVKINYIDNAPKASDLRIMLCSSDKTNEDDIFVSTFNSRYESAKHGATLVVDNLTFTY